MHTALCKPSVKAFRPDRTSSRVSALNPPSEGEAAMLKAVLMEKFDKFDAKLDARFDKLDAKFDAKFDKLDGKLDNLATDVQQLKLGVEVLKVDIKWRSQFYFLIALVAIPLLSTLLPLLLKALPQ
uniref:t-SNARE coiled-coil homology domain-containing protein n=1 Tax=Tetradesmus obliquus TaxID=3088 RepID=A0A383W1W9_TETOB|eukprot:jgi/Sobl393_1/18382/SZX71647.1